MKTKLLLLVTFFASALYVSAAPVKVLIWDERQERQAEAYDNFLGNEIAKQLKASAEGFAIRSVALDDPGQGLDDLEWADVLVWWGHVRQDEVTEENVARIMERLLAGELDLIALHSAHFASPFMEAMNWRSREDARAHFAELDEGKIMKFEDVAPPKPRSVPTFGSVVTPAYFAYKLNRTNFQAMVHLPWCCFPTFRPDAEPGTITTTLPEHPIAKGLPATWEVAQTEMYGEPFHVPEPDEVIFEERWELGEWFRSGMVWEIGKGKVFYFRPGHEQYPVFKQKEVVKVLENACLWLGGE
jgi:trehalose utilization protein